MTRLATAVLAASLLMLAACQRGNEADTAAKQADAPAAAPADAAATAASPAPSAPAATSAAAFNVEPFGIESCDKFVAAINHCFATAKVHPSAVQILRSGYEQELQRWSRMKAEPAMATMLEKVCQTQLNALPESKKGLQCE